MDSLVASQKGFVSSSSVHVGFLTPPKNMLVGKFVTQNCPPNVNVCVCVSDQGKAVTENLSKIVHFYLIKFFILYYSPSLLKVA